MSALGCRRVAAARYESSKPSTDGIAAWDVEKTSLKGGSDGLNRLQRPGSCVTRAGRSAGDVHTTATDQAPENVPCQMELPTHVSSWFRNDDEDYRRTVS